MIRSAGGARRLPLARHARLGTRATRGKRFYGFKLNLNFVWYTFRTSTAMGAGERTDYGKILDSVFRGDML